MLYVKIYPMNQFSSKIPVYINQCDSCEESILQPLIQNHLDCLQVPAQLSSKRILLKPNLISASAPSLACTSPAFVAAVAACFLKRGAKVCLGDSPAFGSAWQVLKKQGFTRELSGLDIQYLEFKSVVRKRLDCGIDISVAAEALECDYFVNLPRIKAHEQMGVTVALKNVFGIIPGARKAMLHMRHGNGHRDFAELILDLHKLLPKTLCLVDGVQVMTRRGPVKGTALHLGCLASSENFVALDRAMLEVLELNKEKIPIAMAAQKQNLPGAFLEDIEFPLLSPDAFAGSGFTIPSDLSPVRFQVMQFIRSSLRRAFT